MEFNTKHALKVTHVTEECVIVSAPTGNQRCRRFSEKDVLYTFSDPTRRYRAIPRVVRHRGIDNLETVQLMTMLDKDLYLLRDTEFIGDTRLEVRFQRFDY